MATKNYWSKEQLVNIQKVKSIKGVKLNTLLMTTNYSEFKRLKGNRGVNVEQKRVKYFNDKITENQFFPLLGLIFVDVNGVIQEGHHRFESLKKAGKPIIFVVIPSMTIEEIATFNTNLPSKWDAENHLNSAMENGSKFAKNFFEIRAKIISVVYGAKGSKNQLNVGEMFGLLTDNIKYFNGGAKNTVKYSEFFNSEFETKALTEDYYNKLKNFVEIKKILQSQGFDRVHNITKVIFSCSIPNTYVRGFSLERFRINLMSEKFDPKDNTASEYRVEAKRIHNINATSLTSAVWVR